MARVTKAREYLRGRILNARHAIYKLGKPVKGVVIERILKGLSLVPTFVSQHQQLPCFQLPDDLSENAFAERLSPFGFKLFPIFVVDLMHEFELGILKSVLSHLIQILYVLDSELVAILNEWCDTDLHHLLSC